jgi:hypothetical protein
VAAPEPTSAGRCGPKLQLMWQHVDARPAPCLDLELVCGGTQSSGCRQSSGVDNNWYTDSVVTTHITGDLDQLTIHDYYPGTDQIHTANGKGMDIARIGKTIILTLAVILSLITSCMFLTLKKTYFSSSFYFGH